MKNIFRFASLALLTLGLILSTASSTFAAATITILNADDPGEGFNDTTPVSPVGGNPGTTLGQQRLNAFQHAAGIWGSTLTSSTTITIRAQFNPLTCNATSAVLGSAGAAFIEFNFTNAPFANTLYSEALAEKLSGNELEPTHDINAQFNSNLGQSGCLTGQFFYLGYDNNHGNNVDLVAVLLHEFGHGLGFQTFTSNSTGAQNSGLPAIFDRFLIDVSNGKSWLQMTDSERQASAINTRKLAWDGPKVFADVPTVLSFGVPYVVINSPAVIAGRYDATTVGWAPSPSAGGTTANLKLANDGVASPSVTDGCEAFAAGFFSGQIAVIDRGTCSAKLKAANAQNAGATGLIVVNNVAGSPAPSFADDPAVTTTITIPVVVLTQPDGNAIKGQLGSGVNGTLKLDTTVRAGADPTGKALLNTPNPVVGGSSVSHWDPLMTPNQLMEPNINGDLTHNLTPPSDLTYSEMRDIGWEPNPLPNTITASSGNNQSVNINTAFAPLSVSTSPAVAGLKVTFTANSSPEGANGTFAGTGDRIAVVDTDVNGAATAPTLTANGQGGSFVVNATVPGAGTAAFNLTATGPLTLSSAVSRKNHGATPFDIPLPLTGDSGIECRTGGPNNNYTIVFTFPNPVVSGTAAVTAGMGSVSGSPAFSGRTMTVNLTGVIDVQKITVTLSNVTDSSSQVLSSAAVTMRIIVGDVNADNTTNGGDATITRARSGLAVDATTFRSDVNADGLLNSGDATVVKGRSGNQVLP
jgi:hypothetical protein